MSDDTGSGNRSQPPTVESAADDLLLLFAQVEAGSEPSPEQVGELIAARASAGIPKLMRFTRGKPEYARRASQTGYELGADALGGVAAANFTLAARLLAWSATTTGTSHADVVAAVLAQTDVDPEVCD